MNNFICFLCFLLFSSVTFAKTPADFAEYYDVDLDAELPKMEDLREKYFIRNPNYDRKYAYKGEIGDIFDEVFRSTITFYGVTEKRIISQTEENLIEMLELLPKEYYPYIGPFIHTSYGMPEKVKNMPGIKETKNKFPERIAPQLADIDNIEFLSPVLYLLLMPEMWPSNLENLEYTPHRQEEIYVKVNIPKELIDKVHKIVPPDEFYPDYESDGKTQIKDLQTLSPTKNSPLSSGDIKAIAKTFSKVDKFTHSGNNYLTLIEAGNLLDAYEKENGKSLSINMLKDLVNPCQRLVQKIKLAGLQTEFAKIISEDGFDPKTWAYTCDKTIKAYRKSQINSYVMQDIISYRKGIYNDYIYEHMNAKKRDIIFATMQSAIEMYDSPENDWLEAMKNYNLLHEELKKVNFMIGTSKLIL